MKQQKIFTSVLFILSILVMSVFLISCKPQVQTKGTVAPSSRLQVELSLADKPLLKVPVTLKLKIISIAPSSIKNISAKIDLPEGFELISGNLSWNGDLNASSTVQRYSVYAEEGIIEAVVKSTKVGYYQLKGSAISKQLENTFGIGTFSDSAIIYVEISQNDAIIGSKPENNWYEPTIGIGMSVAENNEQIKSELTLSNIPELNKDFTIAYKVKPLIDLPSQRSYLDLVFPPKAFKLVNVKFPSDGETYQRESQLSWIGKINVNQTVEIIATFRVLNTGWGNLYGSLDSQSGSGGRGVTDFVRDVKIAKLYVDKYKGNYTIINLNVKDLNVTNAVEIGTSIPRPVLP